MRGGSYVCTVECCWETNSPVSTYRSSTIVLTRTRIAVERRRGKTMRVSQHRADDQWQRQLRRTRRENIAGYYCTAHILDRNHREKTSSKQQKEPGKGEKRTEANSAQKNSRSTRKSGAVRADRTPVWRYGDRLLQPSRVPLALLGSLTQGADLLLLGICCLPPPSVVLAEGGGDSSYGQAITPARYD